MRSCLSTALAVTAASVLVAGASAATAATQGHSGRAVIANTGSPGPAFFRSFGSRPR